MLEGEVIRVRSVVVSRSLRMRKAPGSNPGVSKIFTLNFYASKSNLFKLIINGDKGEKSSPQF